MVCPNCHSDQVIAVQDQHFCISCGQIVPEAPQKSGTSGVAVQDNGLPEGVKILPVAAPKEASPAPSPSAAKSDSEPVVLVKSRARIGADEAATATSPGTGAGAPQPAAKVKKRRAGRPKSGRLDAPKAAPSPSAAATASAAAIPAPAALPRAPKIAAAKPVVASGPRRMSDIAPPRPAAAKTPASEAEGQPPAAATPTHVSAPKHKTRKPAKKPARAKHHAHQVHKVGVPPLHYGAAVSFSLRARVRPRLLALATLASLSFAAAAGYGAWLVLNGGVNGLAAQLEQGGLQTILGVVILAALYYIGRNIGQAAITYGVIREADQRPVSLSRQLGIAINTFGRRLTLDIGFGALELLLASIIIAMVFTAGGTWPVDPQLQVAAIFGAFLTLLYLLTALALSRGLAAVALVLTPKSAWAAAKLGWSLFSHRFELLALRFSAAAMELVLAVPLAALAVAFVVAAPAQWYWAVTIGVAELAWIAGALLGAGTAAWWAALYRKLVLVDRPDATVSLLSSRQPQDANRIALSLIVSLSTLLVAAALALPWLKI